MAFTEFYCNPSTGANINAGDLTANGVVTSTNGAWSTVTNIFTATSGTPFSGVTAGDFAALYADGATVATYLARVTTVGGGGLTLTLSTTAISGTAPTTAGTGITCTTGGAWKGPNAGVTFPFNILATTLTNSSGDPYRVNMKNNATYSITSGISMGNGPGVVQGYTTTIGDGGKFILDGGTSNIAILTLATANAIYDFIVQNNSTSSNTAQGITCNASGSILARGVISGTGANGISGGCNISEVEVFDCGKSNSTNRVGINLTNSGVVMDRVIVHDCVSGTTAHGIIIQGHCVLTNVISESNGGDGVNIQQAINSQIYIDGLDCYNNTGDGLDFSATAGTARTNLVIENSNFIKNGGWGIKGQTTTAANGLIRNCGYGQGTMANSSGTNTALGGIVESGQVLYATDAIPWVDAPNGDFRITLSTAKGAGRGTYVETAASYAGTIGYPDIGAAQHLDSGGGGGTNTKITIGASLRAQI